MIREPKSLSKLFCLIFCILSLACQGRTTAPGFDKTQAFSYLTRQCEFGARYPGSAAHLQVRDYLVAELRRATDDVRLQPFSAVNYLMNQRAQGYNIIAKFGTGATVLLLCAHWDSRPLADQDPEPANRSKMMPAANDGAAGVAILLEIARNLRLQPPPLPVEIVLFDAEDMGRESHSEEFLQGSRFFAQNLAHDYKPGAAILLDLVGDRDLQLYIEQNSQNYAPDLVNRVWTAAEELNISEFVRQPRYAVIDDHLSLLEAGIPAIDIIDFDYPYWHTTADTPDKCSPESLEKVGKVLLKLIYGKPQ